MSTFDNTKKIHNKNNFPEVHFIERYRGRRTHHFDEKKTAKISLFWSVENLQAAEAALESSEDEEFGEGSPPPSKKSRLEINSKSRSPTSSGSSMSKKEKMQKKSSCNGESESSENGDVLCDISNGASSPLGERMAALKEKNREKVLQKKLSKFDEELLRLVGQHLNKLGFSKTVNCLMKESGCQLENSAASQFREYCLRGDWLNAEKVLKELKPSLNTKECFLKMKFLILEQKFLELLEDNRVIDALHCLRMELAPLKFDVHRVHELSSLLMCPTVEDLLKKAKWDGKNSKTRQLLVNKLQAFLPATVMLPPDRLEVLIKQALQHQQSKCIYHNLKPDEKLESISILSDHVCSKESFPCETAQILSDHCGEVWFLRFSNNGKYLATGSKDTTIIIWKIQDGKLTSFRTLEGHSYGVAFMMWSPDDEHLIACGPDDCCELWIWHVQSGDLKCRMSHSPEDSLTCCAWFDDNKKFVTGGTRGQFYQCDLDGNVLESWEGVRVTGLFVQDDKNILASDTHMRVRSYNFDDVIDKHLIQENHPIMSFAVSQDRSKILLNVSSQGVNLWDIKDKVLIRKFRGVTQGYYLIHSCFGGMNNNFIASGSEDKKVYIWHHSRENPIATLSGHSHSVNCVHWNPTDPTMLASASDDGTVRIWRPESVASSLNPSSNDTNPS